MGKPRHGTEVKEHKSIRLEPSIEKIIKKKHGKLQAWIDKKILEDKLHEEIEPIDPKKD